MQMRRWFTLTVARAMVVMSFVSACFGLTRPVSARRVAHPAQKLSSGGGGPMGLTFPIHDETGLEEVSPAVAYNPDREEYLVVWYNDRAGCDDIQGQRMSKGGAPLGGPFFISAGCDEDRGYPDVAYNSGQDQYLVVWEQYESTSGSSIQARRVSGNGQVVDDTDIGIRGPGYNLYTPAKPAVAYASTSDRYLVVWQETSHPMPITYEIVGQRLTETGSSDGSRFTVSQGSEIRATPDVAYCRTRNEHLVAWRQASGGDYDIHARRVAGGGGALGSTVFVSTLGHDEEDPAVAALPLANQEGHYLVAWEIDTGSDRGVMARNVAVDSGGNTSFGLYRVVANEPDDEVNPAVAGTEGGGRYLMTWNQLYVADIGGGMGIVWLSIVGRELSPEGELLGDGLTRIGGVNATHSAVAGGPLGDFLVAFDDSVGDSGIYGRLWGNRVYLPLVVRRS